MSQYDERLLASAPVATRAEKQEGYNVDLLEGPRNTGKISPPPVPPTIPLASNIDHAENGRKQESYAKYADDTPWYKTKKGLIGIVIVVIVVIAAVVGGAVGGTVGKSNNNNSNANATSSSTSGSNTPTSAAPEGNQGGAPTSSVASSTGNPGASVGAGAPPIALPTLI